MNNTLWYIFNRFKTQSALNVIFAGVLWVTVAQVKQQQYEIKKLTKKVEELEKEKGE